MIDLLLLEPDTSAADILALGIRKKLDCNVLHAADIASAVRMLQEQRVFIAIVNHNLHDDTFAKCFQIKSVSSGIKVIVITAPGASFRQFSELKKTTAMIDAVVDKPVVFDALADLVRQFMQTIKAQQESTQTLIQFQKYLPRTLSNEEIAGANSGDAFITERTILFTDIRRSTQLIRKENLEQYFQRINKHFNDLGEIVEKHKGEVIKYTGDGMLATFGGFGRQYLGFKCAQEILKSENGLDAEFNIGLGLNDGLVMVGFIGSRSRIFYDVIGANVNIAARLCEKAQSNQILMTKAIQHASRIDPQALTEFSLKVKGLPDPINCFQFTLSLFDH